MNDRLSHECAKCGREFPTCGARTSHEKSCTDLVFVDGELFSVKVTKEPSYRERIARAAECDPVHYAKYAKRQVPSEPNNMSTLYIYLSEREKRGREEERLRSRPGTGQERCEANQE